MKLRLEDESDVKTFSIRLEDDGLTLVDSKEGWEIVSLRVVDGKIALVRFESINDSAYLTDNNGRIKEVEE